jgi:hypothetical protein
MVMFFSKKSTPATVVVGGREYPEVTWYKNGSLVHLHALCIILLLSSATNGYDGSMSRWHSTFSDTLYLLILESSC